MDILFLILLVSFQIKHFVADYLLQPAWILRGKADPAHFGGYVHVAIHGIGSVAIMLLYGLPVVPLVLLTLGECVVHYLIDLTKARWSARRQPDVASRAFWAAHGADQLMHQLTYAVMIFLILMFSRVG